MAAVSLDDFCHCCRKLIERKDKFYLKLLGEKSSREGIGGALRKYGDKNACEEDIGAVSTTICRSCYLLVTVKWRRQRSFTAFVTSRRKAFCSRDRDLSQTEVPYKQLSLPPFYPIGNEGIWKLSKSSSTNFRVCLFKTILPKPVDADANSLDTKVLQNRF